MIYLTEGKKVQALVPCRASGKVTGAPPTGGVDNSGAADLTRKAGDLVGDNYGTIQSGATVQAGDGRHGWRLVGSNVAISTAPAVCLAGDGQPLFNSGRITNLGARGNVTVAPSALRAAMPGRNLRRYSPAPIRS